MNFQTNYVMYAKETALVLFSDLSKVRHTIRGGKFAMEHLNLTCYQVKSKLPP